jgi:hypothetical protein
MSDHHVATVEERLRRVSDAVVLIEASLTAIVLDRRDELCHNQVTEVVKRLSTQASNDLHYLVRLPEVIGSLPAPTDDDIPNWKADRTMQQIEQMIVNRLRTVSERSRPGKPA